MARIRTIKPELFLHEELFDLERETGLPIRLSFVGLWCHADREGRFHWRPRTLGAQILPFDGVDFSRVLHALTTRGFIVKYASEGVDFGWIPTFKKHQVINPREKASEIAPPDASILAQYTSTRDDASATRDPRDDEVCAPERNGTEGNKIIPDRSVPNRSKLDLEICNSIPELEAGLNTVLEPLPPKGLSKGAFAVLKEGHLVDTLAVVEWHAKQLSLPDPVSGATEADLLFCLAAGLFASRIPAKDVRKSRVGAFVDIVRFSRLRKVSHLVPEAAVRLKQFRESENGNGHAEK